MFILSPLESFETIIYQNKFLLFLDISLTNIVIYFIFIFFGLFLFFIWSTYNLWIIPTNWQIVIENLYIFVIDLFKQQVQILSSFCFFPFFFSFFSFILLSNLVGLLPYSFTITSQIIINFTLAFSIVLGITLFGFIFHKINFMKFFIPSGVPTALIPVLFILEIISYCIRPFSLSIRLFANLLAGHTLLNILSSFGLIFLKKYPIFVIIPLVFIFFIIILEFCIAFIQAYVFLILSLIYLGDIYNLNH